MTTRAAVAVCWLGFAACASSQEAAPPAQEPCVSQERTDADRPVDDYIAAIDGHYQLSARSPQHGYWKKEAQKALVRLRPQADDCPAPPTFRS